MQGKKKRVNAGDRWGNRLWKRFREALPILERKRGGNVKKQQIKRV